MCQVFFFFSSSRSLSLLLLGRCSVRLVICFKCFLGNETRQEDGRYREALALNAAHRGDRETGGCVAGASGDKLASYTPHATC